MPGKPGPDQRWADRLLYDHVGFAKWFAALKLNRTGPSRHGKGRPPAGVEAGNADIWSTEDVRLRLEEAGRTLMALPLPKGGLPRKTRSNWPDVIRGYEDAISAFVGASDMAKQEYADRHNQVRVMPSVVDVDRMDEVLDWLWRIDDPRKRRLCLCRALMHPVSGRHIISFRKLGRLFGLHHETMRAWHDRALAQIAVSLTANKIPKTKRLGRRPEPH